MTNFVSDIAKAIEASLATYAQARKNKQTTIYDTPGHFLEKIKEKFPNATLKRVSGGVALECGPGCLKALAQSRDDL